MVVDLRSGLDRRQLSDRRGRVDRRSDRQRRHSSLDDRRHCDMTTAAGERCDKRALVRGCAGEGWICLEHLVIAQKADGN